MALTNAQRQARWRDSRNEDAQALKGEPEEIAENILRILGPTRAWLLARALDKLTGEGADREREGRA
jgi:hypothetical protein